MKRLSLALVLVFTLALAARGQEIQDGIIILPEQDPLDFSGDIVIAGSSTVFPLTNRMAQRFTEDGFLGKITIDSIGTGAGFERFCVSGDSDISNASRAIRAAEVDKCRANGREPLEFRVGTDALVVVVNNDNDFVKDLSLEELALLFSTAKLWSDVRPEFPAEPIARFIPGTDSGTFDFFVEAVFKGDEAAILAADNLRLSEDDDVLAKGIEANQYAVGFFGFAYLASHIDRVHAIAVEGVEPNEQSAEDGSYPLARPLFIYSDAKIMTDKPQVAAFIGYYLSLVNEEILDVGYFPASDDALNLAKNTWLAAMGLPAFDLEDEAEATPEATAEATARP
ncbi:MAG: PstS family phosphate ABC transporter substrate-binding protein [Anaerolineae bacterium]|nr:PstS family phosphate ABC transporter substrate-binding protein [Anaerolineae bacterium]MDW8172344.1 PstS family phosphate ABC transporter substrate-binding protein [Anaerolineae bacterium]